MEEKGEIFVNRACPISGSYCFDWQKIDQNLDTHKAFWMFVGSKWVVRFIASNLSGLWRSMQHAPISRARYVQENRKMRFKEALDGWTQGRLTQAEAALLRRGSRV